jgi:hypothetical protein
MRPGVQQVRQTAVHLRGLSELAVDDLELGLGVVARQQADLVVVEGAAHHLQPAALEADAGAVAVGRARAAELDVLDQHLAAAHDQDALALGMPAARPQHRAFADAPQRQPPLLDDPHLTVVLAGHQRNGVAVRGHGQRVAQAHRRRGRPHYPRGSQQGCGQQKARQAHQARKAGPPQRGEH